MTSFCCICHSIAFYSLSLFIVDSLFILSHAHTYAQLQMQAHSHNHNRCGHKVTPAQQHRKQKYTDAEVLELLLASDEEELSDCSSAPDSVSSGDEVDFFEGIDPFQDT